MNDKKVSDCVARKARLKMNELQMTRLCVFRSSQHIYAGHFGRWQQSISFGFYFDSQLRDGATGNIEQPKVGQLVPSVRKPLGYQSGFDRSGFKYHGRVKALADAAREGGLSFKLWQITSKNAITATTSRVGLHQKWCKSTVLQNR